MVAKACTVKHLSIPAAFAFRQCAFPISSAAVLLPPLPDEPIMARTSASAVEADARTRAVARNDAGINVQIGAIHGQTHSRLLRNPDARLAGTTETLLFWST